MKQSKRKRTLAQLDADRKAHRITLQMVADEAAKTARFGTMADTTVSNVLAGRTKSQNVLDALRRLIAQAEAKPAEAVA